MRLIKHFYYKIKKYHLLKKNKIKKNRNLEIGPGVDRINNFETLNIIPGNNIDYYHDASIQLPFENDTFSIIYASHVLEHIPWYKTEVVLQDWIRTLKKEGWIEIWIPDGYKIIKTFLDAENGDNNIESDGWYKFNQEKDPCIWLSGRCFSYGDGKDNLANPNWHRAIFTFNYLEKVFLKIGLKNISKMTKNEIRGYDHGWINLGIKGQK